MYDIFKNITNYDIGLFIDRYISFIDNEYNDIDTFFLGQRSDLNRNSVELFKNIKNECEFVLSLFLLYKESFKTSDFWNLLIDIENIQERLESINNLPRWYRTNNSLSNYSNTINSDYVLGQNQTIDNIISLFDGNENDFIKISVNNNAIEENVIDGFKVNFQLKKSIENNIESVIDSLNNESVYGLDINREIEFLGSDLLTLNHKDTLTQLIDILLGLKINDNPEDPSAGIDPSVLIGNPIKNTNAPIILRQINSTFNKEDIIKSIAFNRVVQDQDNVFYYFTIETKAGEKTIETLKL